jgi:37-kD nucleoid-associated bacterial protein
MEQYTDVAVDDCFAIHVLDNRLPAEQCSQTLTPLPDSLRTALEKYLLSILRPNFRRKHFGRFRPASPVLQEYQRLCSAVAAHGGVEPAVFLEVSQRLAARLFTAMRQGPQNGAQARPGDITPGDLLVGLFRGRAPQASSVPYLFLLKVELESGLQRRVRPLAQGGIQTVLTACEGLLPRLTAVHLHKSALIQQSYDPSMYDVLMTDPQGGKHGVAKFFAEDFLQTEPFQTPDQQAELLFTRTHAWVTEHEDILSPQEQQEILQAVRSQITAHVATTEPLVPRELVAALPLCEPRTAETVQALRQSFQETLMAPEEESNSIALDRELVLRIVPQRLGKTRITYQLDGGVQLSGEQEALERLFVRPPHRVNGATELTIRTATFRPLL